MPLLLDAIKSQVLPSRMYTQFVIEVQGIEEPVMDHRSVDTPAHQNILQQKGPLGISNTFDNSCHSMALLNNCFERNAVQWILLKIITSGQNNLIMLSG